MYILAKEGEEDIEDMFESREPVLVEDVAQVLMNYNPNLQIGGTQDERTF